MPQGCCILNSTLAPMAEPSHCVGGRITVFKVVGLRKQPKLCSERQTGPGEDAEVSLLNCAERWPWGGAVPC